MANLDKAALPITTTLPNAVADWLGYLGVVQELSTEDQGKIGHTLRVQTQGSVEFYDLTNVGVGVSQVPRSESELAYPTDHVPHGPTLHVAIDCSAAISMRPATVRMGIRTAATA